MSSTRRISPKALQFRLRSLFLLILVVAALFKAVTWGISYAKQRCFPDQFRIPDAPPTARELTPFLSITRDMTMVDVVRRCGLPDEEKGSGLCIFVYHLNDGSTVILGTGDVNQLLTHAYHQNSGQVVDLLSPQDKPAHP